MKYAITRKISPTIGRCELTHIERQPIDLDLANWQHHQYEAALAELGCRVIGLPAEPDLPDSVFVEDIAVVLDELAIITRPGAQSRRAEALSIAAALKPYRRLVYIQEPGTIDGGDVLRVYRTIYIGLTERSNPDAIEQFRAILAPLGYAVQGVPVRGCLHLKSAVTQIAPDALLINPDWVDMNHFDGMRFIRVDESEPYAANGLFTGGGLIYPAEYPMTRGRLEAEGIPLRLVPVSELAKAEGAVTCCSLIFEE
ncbi:MAG TPA: N(G),N(G)-dimethylarginine dimethylaminohydrolase [Levilinea sp.]|nr:N(G),N(G)-dimethylarginine dimethylaminohydrolase [Levilinea sp.]